MTLSPACLAGDIACLDWQKDLPAAEALARKEGKRVLCFVLLGDLTADDC
ncbi:MAG: hypothetical protein HYZ53_26570 [Planctomycetes bacterium]|nr:hypothetical protein [Planctomycetota bacterium]